MSDILRAGNSLRQVVTRCAPAWRQQFGGEHDRAPRLLMVLQEMLWWPLREENRNDAHAVPDFVEHLGSQGLSWEESAVPFLEDVWHGLRSIVSEGAAGLISSYLHLWNPLTHDRDTVPYHFPAAFAGHWASSRSTRDRAWQLYRLLDQRGRAEVPPLYTANQLLQRTRFPSDYRIYWGLASAEGDPASISIGPAASDRLLRAIPDLRTWLAPGPESGPTASRLEVAADAVYRAFANLAVSSVPELLPAVDRVQLLFREVMREEIPPRQALFFLFGLAVNRCTLRCENLYQFVVAHGRSCSILSLATEAPIGGGLAGAFQHLAHSLLYPLMLGAFFDAKGEVEENVYCDLSHEREPVTVALTRIEVVRAALAARQDPQAAALVKQLDTGAAMLRFNDDQAGFIGSLYKVGQPLISPLDLARAAGQRLDMVREIASCSPEILPQICDQVSHVDPASIYRADEKEVPARLRQASREGSATREALVRILLAHHVRLEASEPCPCLAHQAALNLILMNAVMNALKWNDWRRTLTSGPATDVIVRITTTGSRCGDGPTVSVSNCPQGEVGVAGWVPPYSFEDWWRARRTGRRGGRIMRMALRYLLPMVPHEVSSTWLEVVYVDPFIVRLHLPSKSYLKRLRTPSVRDSEF